MNRCRIIRSTRLGPRWRLCHIRPSRRCRLLCPEPQNTITAGSRLSGVHRANVSQGLTAAHNPKPPFAPRRHPSARSPSWRLLIDVKRRPTPVLKVHWPPASRLASLAGLLLPAVVGMVRRACIAENSDPGTACCKRITLQTPLDAGQSHDCLPCIGFT